MLVAATTLLAPTSAASTTGPDPVTKPATEQVTSPVDVDPIRRIAGEKVYGPPVWLPLRTEADGGTITVGCTYRSHGSPFGYECGGHHDRWAIDFIAPAGTPAYAAGAGFATNLTGKPGGSGFGNVVRVDHGFGVATLYAHLSTVAIPDEGRWVDETTSVGTIGSTGSSSTPHLHFERRQVAAGSVDPSTASTIAADPGPLFACTFGMLVSFPQVAGRGSWEGTAWGQLEVASEGPDCVDGPTEPSAGSTAPTWAQRIGVTLRLFNHSQDWSALAI